MLGMKGDLTLFDRFNLDEDLDDDEEKDWDDELDEEL